jgi:transposase
MFIQVASRAAGMNLHSNRQRPTAHADRGWEVEDGLWERIVPLLPQVKRNPRYPGRPRLDDRKVLNGILFVDSSHLRAMKGGPATGPSPVDRAKAGSKHHLIVEAHGIPLAAITTGGNRNDVTQLLPLIGAIPPVRGLRGRPRQRPRHLYADRGYDHETYRDQVRALQITPRIARRGTGHGSQLGVYRWVVEGAIALLHWFRRLRIRWEIRDDIHHAFVTLGCAIICWRRLGQERLRSSDQK